MFFFYMFNFSSLKVFLRNNFPSNLLKNKLLQPVNQPTCMYVKDNKRRKKNLILLYSLYQMPTLIFFLLYFCSPMTDKMNNWLIKAHTDSNRSFSPRHWHKTLFWTISAPSLLVRNHFCVPLQPSVTWSQG